ncbi:MAG: hypothetical protein ACK47B_05590 [Armatimonadota bacterium]
MSWRDAARADLAREGALRFWLGWRGTRPELRKEAYGLARFTPAARAVFDHYGIVVVPSGLAWVGALLSQAVPRWVPRAGALPSTPWVGAACLHPLPLIAGVARALTPRVVAHELAHVIWPHLSPALRGGFPRVLAELEARDPQLTRSLDHWLAGYRDRRSPDECHVRLLEYYDYGRSPLPAELRPYYAGWIEECPPHSPNAGAAQASPSP